MIDNHAARGIGSQRELIVAALWRLVRRRRRLHKELAIEALAAILGGVAAAFGHSSCARLAVSALALCALVLAGRDRRRLRALHEQIDALQAKMARA